MEDYHSYADAKKVKSPELESVNETFAGGRVRVFGDYSYYLARRTEIDLPDGRLVTVHKNPEITEMDGEQYFGQSRYDSIVVSKDGDSIGTIGLGRVNRPGFSDHHYYLASLNGRKLNMVSGSDRTSRPDLALADHLLDWAISLEGNNLYFGRGSMRQLAAVVWEMVPGYSEQDIVGMYPELFEANPAL